MKRIFTFWIVFMLAGCEGPFAPQTLVERLRILGIQAEPPESGPFDEITLNALVADPQGAGRQMECSWGVCLIDLGYAAKDIACPGPDSYMLEGDCSSARLYMPDLVEWLAEQGYGPPDLPEEIPEEYQQEDPPLFVGLEVLAGSERTSGIKRVTINLSGQEPNINPVLLGVEMDGQPLGEQPVSLPFGSQISLAPIVDESSRQTYRREGEDEDLLEDFLFSWFSTAGEFSERRTILDVDSHGERLDINEWTLDGEYTLPGPVTLWIIVRDGRFGTAWQEFSFEVLGPE